MADINVPSGFVEVPVTSQLDEPISSVEGNPVPEGFAVVENLVGDSIPAPTRPVDNIILSENGSSMGRILESFGQGLSHGWGTDPVGLDPETEAFLSRSGVFRNGKGGFMAGFQHINEAIMRPLSAGLDTLLKSGAAIGTAVSGAIGQTAVEAGADQGTGRRLTRDMMDLALAIGVTTGNAPQNLVVRKGATKPTLSKAKQKRGSSKEDPTRPELGEAQTDGSFVPSPNAENVLKDVAPGAINTKNQKPVSSTSKNAVEDVDIDSHSAIDAEFPLDPDKIPDSQFAGNVNLENLDTSEGLKGILAQISERNGGFDAQRRGKLSLEEQQGLADMLDIKVKDLDKITAGQAFNAEELLSLRSLMVDMAARVRTTATVIRNGENSTNNLLKLEQQILELQTVQRVVSGGTAEAGRSLRSLRQRIAGDVELEAVKDVLEELGGAENIELIAEMIASRNTPRDISKLVNRAGKSRVAAVLQEIWINSLLSGPTTQAVNFVSNSLVAMNSVLETSVAYPIGIVRSALSRNKDRVLLGEVPAEVFGTLQGMKDGLRLAAHVFLTDGVDAGRIGTKLDRQAAKGKSNLNATPGVFGRIIRTPGNLLMSTDAWFQTIGQRQSLWGQAYRKASQEKLKGKAFRQRVVDLVNNPTEGMKKAALARAREQTFTDPLGGFGQGISRISNTNLVTKVIIPFVRTPLNIVKFAGKRTLAAPLSKTFRADIKAGGARADRAIAKVVIGTSAMYSAYQLAADGVITGGGPDNAAQRGLMYALGWQPYSILVDGVYHSYGRLEPLGILLGLGADFAEISSQLSEVEEGDTNALAEVFAIGALSAANNLASKTWMQGVTGLIEAMQDGKRYGASFSQRLIGTLVPTGLAQIARTDDPALRDAQGVLEALKARIPGYRKTIHPRYDIWGEPIVLQGGLGPDILSPIYVSRLQNDPVTKTLLRNQIYPAGVQDEINDVTLTRDEYDVYQRIAGKTLRFALETNIFPGFEDMPKGIQKDMLITNIRSARQNAKTQMLMRFPRLIIDGINVKMEDLQ